jgi:transketolase
MLCDPQDVSIAFGEALVELGKKNPRVIVVESDLADSCRSHLFRAEFPERSVLCGSGGGRGDGY